MIKLKIYENEENGLGYAGSIYKDGKFYGYYSTPRKGKPAILFDDCHRKEFDTEGELLSYVTDRGWTWKRLGFRRESLVRERFENIDIENDPNLDKYLQDYVDHVVMFGGQVEVEDQIYRDFSYNPAIASEVVRKFRKMLHNSMKTEVIGRRRGRGLLEKDDNKIEVKHPGILEVPENKNVDDLPMSHFEKLANKKGLGKITKALNNLQVWNKKKDPELSKWAGNMIDKLNKKLKKESVLREYTSDNYTNECIPMYSTKAGLALRKFAKKLDPEAKTLFIYTTDIYGSVSEKDKKKVARAKNYHPEWFEIGKPIGEMNVMYLRNNKDASRMFSKLEKKALSFAKADIDEGYNSLIPTGWKERTIYVEDDEQEAAVEEILEYAKGADDRIEWDIDYQGGMFGTDRIFYIYSDGDTYSECKHKVKQLKDDAIYGRGVYESNLKRKRNRRISESSNNQKIVARSFDEMIERMENEWGFDCVHYDSDYLDEIPDSWLTVYDSEGNEYECEFFRYSDGRYEIYLRNCNMTGNNMYDDARDDNEWVETHQPEFRAIFDEE